MIRPFSSCTTVAASHRRWRGRESPSRPCPRAVDPSSKRMIPTEVAGRDCRWVIAEEDRWPVDESASNRDPLLFATGQLAGIAIGLVLSPTIRALAGPADRSLHGACRGLQERRRRSRLPSYWAGLEAWKTVPTERRRNGPSRRAVVCLCPSTQIRPRVTVSWRSNSRISVDLPDPEGPTRRRRRLFECRD